MFNVSNLADLRLLGIFQYIFAHEGLFINEVELNLLIWPLFYI